MKRFIILIMTFTIIINFNIDVLARNDGIYGEAISLIKGDSIEVLEDKTYIDALSGRTSNEVTLRNVSSLNKNITIGMKNNGIKDLKFYINSEKKEIVYDSVLLSNTLNIDFKPKEILKVQITYSAIIGKEHNGDMSIGYEFMPFNTWKSEIKDSKLEIDFGDEMYKYNIEVLNGLFRKVDSKYIWEAKNYIPKKNIELKYIKKEYEKMDRPLKDKSVYVDMLSLLSKDKEESYVLSEYAYEIEKRLKDLGVLIVTSENNADYVITLSCLKGDDIGSDEVYIAYEDIHSDKFDKFIISRSICEIFSEIAKKETKIIEPFNGSETPRIILNVGSFNDVNKNYLNDLRIKFLCDKISETIYVASFSDETLENDIKKLEETKKDNYKLILSITVCIIVGIILGILILLLIIQNRLDKNKREFIKWYEGEK